MVENLFMRVILALIGLVIVLATRGCTIEERHYRGGYYHGYYGEYPHRYYGHERYYPYPYYYYYRDHY